MQCIFNADEIYIELSTAKRTLTMNLDPQQARAMLDVLFVTDEQRFHPKPAAKDLYDALCAIRDGKTIVIHEYDDDNPTEEWR